MGRNKEETGVDPQYRMITVEDNNKAWEPNLVATLCSQPHKQTSAEGNNNNNNNNKA